MRLYIPFRFTSRYAVAGILATAMVASAQNTGWRRLNAPNAPTDQSDPSTPVARDDADYPPQAPNGVAAQAPNAAPAPGPDSAPGPVPAGPIPTRLTIQPGTFLTIRNNQPLSSDHNHEGDFFSGTLAEPVVVDGVVVAQRGQSVAGRVSTVERGGHGKGASKLGIELTSLTAVDGQQIPLQTQLVTRAGRSNTGRDVATVGTTTAVGAVIGTAADWGRGAVIGAGVGAVAGLIGVLVSPGAPALVYPEALLTFRVQAATSISTDRAPQAFRYVDPSDYQPPQVIQSQMQPPPRPAPAPYYAPYAYPYPYPYYAYSPYPYYWGPSFGVVIGPRWGWGGWGRGGYYRGWRR
jgi:hypothetical protein